MLSGLPPLVRDGDQFSAMLTLRNTTAREMKMRVTLAGSASNASAGIAPTPIALAPQDVAIAAGRCEGGDLAGDRAQRSGQHRVGSARPRRRQTRPIALRGPDEGDAAVVAARCPSACCRRRCRNWTARSRVPVAAPADALPETGTKRGGLNVGVQPRLSGALPGMRRYFETYPYSCLEQMTSKAIGLRDAKLWSALVNALPTYLDADGLANYFPPRAEDKRERQRSPHRLPARRGARVRLRAPAARARPDAGRTRGVSPKAASSASSGRRGRTSTCASSPPSKRLSRYGRAQPRMLGSVNVTPNLWPTAAVIDWFNILRRVDGDSRPGEAAGRGRSRS